MFFRAGGRGSAARAGFGLEAGGSRLEVEGRRGVSRARPLARWRAGAGARAHLLQEQPVDVLLGDYAHGPVVGRVHDGDAADALLHEALHDARQLVLRHGRHALVRRHHERRDRRHPGRVPARSEVKTRHRRERATSADASSPDQRPPRSDRPRERSRLPESCARGDEKNVSRSPFVSQRPSLTDAHSPEPSLASSPTPFRASSTSTPPLRASHAAAASAGVSMTARMLSHTSSGDRLASTSLTVPVGW